MNLIFTAQNFNRAALLRKIQRQPSYPLRFIFAGTPDTMA